ncbi:MAG: FtsX-like permease family protein [Desulfobacterales bacterium]|nr:FtsX-like permease family protein [Desulfobacterales bacterium]
MSAAVNGKTNISEELKKAEGINRLVVLPFKKSVEIAYKSIKVRFFRSLITTMSLVLAVSFLSFVSVTNDVANGFLATQNPDLRQALVRSGYDIAPEDTSVGSSPKQKWIIVLSLLVCVVGIVNAQLMAVTERFREIGTMKCLGALDRFVLRLFLLEASMQGLVGSVVGAVAGAIFAIINNFIRFGTVVFVELAWLDVLFSILLASLIGCFLSLVGVFYPALVAARMQPVEAMRVEQ